MTKAPETVDAEKAPALAALQDLKYELETPKGWLVGEAGTQIGLSVEENGFY